MITEERMTTYLNSLYPGNTKLLDRVEEEALRAKVPIIRKETQSLLRFLLRAYEPMNILEVGTAVGFSALLMSEYAPEGCRIITIENYEKGYRSHGRILPAQESRTVSHCWKGMPWRSCMVSMAATILYLWMRRKDSIRTICRKSCGC